MKASFLFLSILLLFFSDKLNAQIECKGFAIVKPGDLNKAVSFGAAPKDVKTVFCNPTKEEQSHNEMFEEDLLIYHYGNCQIIFSKSSIDPDFHFTNLILQDGNIALGEKGRYAVKVGDLLKEIPLDRRDPLYGKVTRYDFPPFTKHLQQNSGVNYISEGLTFDGKPVDATVTFNFIGTKLVSIFLVDNP